MVSLGRTFTEHRSQIFHAENLHGAVLSQPREQVSAPAVQEAAAGVAGTGARDAPEAAGRKAVAIPGDLREESFCQRITSSGP